MGVPAGKCGYKPEIHEDWESQSPVDGVTFTGEYCCYRETHGQSDKCIWHRMRANKQITTDDIDVSSNRPRRTRGRYVDTESSLTDRARRLRAQRIDDAYLESATIKAQIEDFYFYNCRFFDAVFNGFQSEFSEFVHCLLDEAKFEESRIGATFENCSICLTEFRNCEFTGAIFSDSTLMGVRYYECDFKSTTFTKTSFSREVLFSGCSIDHATTFENITVQDSDSKEYRARAKLYGQLADLCLSSREINKYIKYKKMERYAEGKRHRNDLEQTENYRTEYLDRLADYATHEYSRVTMGYGYSIGRVLLSMLVVLVIGAVFFTAFDCISNDLKGMKYACGSGVGILRTFVDSLYFSMVSFTSTGYGDIVPVGLARLVSVIQMYAGLILGAQFLYVLGTKTSI